MCSVKPDSKSGCTLLQFFSKWDQEPQAEKHIGCLMWMLISRSCLIFWVKVSGRPVLGICLLFFYFILFFIFFSFIFISWRLITLQYCSGFCHTLTWISHGFTCVPHHDPPSHLPLYPIPLGLPSAPGQSTYLMHPTWASDLFHPR